LFEYYATRKIEGTIPDDSGATIRDAVKTGNVYGVADETLWPYDVSKFTVNPMRT
jgi:C1A family cysteine protease